jgi:hypothetical protein
VRSARPLLKSLIVVGNVLTVIGCAGLPNEKAGQSALCVPSHSGCRAVCLQAHHQ